MTIAAGFRVRDGIVLCSDSQYTGGSKVYQRKLFGYDLGSTEYPCALAFALAGHENYGLMAIEDCVEAIRSCPLAERSTARVKGLLRATIKQVHESYVDARPESERADSRFDLLIGASLPGAGGLSCFRSSGPAVLAVEGYHCSGMGAYLGDYLIRNTFYPRMQIKDVLLLATQTLAAVKSYDATCGGGSQFIVLPVEGGFTPFNYDVRSAEEYIAAFQEQVRRLLFHFGDIDQTEEQFKGRLRDFEVVLHALREGWKSKAQEHSDLQDIYRRAHQSVSSRTKS
jgi:hypothetical protein